LPEPSNLSAKTSADFDLKDWLAYIEALHPKDIEMGLGRVDEVKQRLSLNIQFPIITIAGTNGKGSTCAMLEHIYHAAGYRVGTYSSPHFLRYSERVRVACQEISDSDLIAAFQAVEKARQSTQLTYFEFGTLAAMWHFAKAGLDVVILEVGLGGRLDAVNVFEPDCAVVTSVDLDHMEFLGDTRESIGAEKAGVFRANVPAICGDNHPPQSLIAHAQKIGADLRLIQRDFIFKRQPDGWIYQGNSRELTGLPMPALKGDFQLENSSCVLTAIEALQAKLPVSYEAIVAGLRSVTLRGRFQLVAGHPDVILDVAHNPHAAKSLAINLQQTASSGKTIAVFSMLADKDIAGVIQALSKQIDVWYIAEIQHARASSLDAMKRLLLARLPDANIQTFESVTQAYHQACIDADENDRIIALGSFFTVAEVMRALHDDSPR
jgi:dihydrofolate synthase/folylpolyglutamate synthase